MDEEDRMTPGQLAAIAQELYGELWKRPLSRELGKDYRLVRRWAAGDRPIPYWLPDRLNRLIRDKSERLRRASAGS